MEPPKKSKQYLATILVNLSSMSVGTTIGWTSPVLPKLFDENQTPLSQAIAQNSSEEAWISSIYTLGAVLASLVSGPISSKVGRKSTALINGVIIAVSYVILLFANQVSIIYLGRLIQGFGAAFMLSSIPLYVGEISSTDCRGTTGSLLQVSIIIGLLYSYSIGPFVSYEAFQWTCIAIPIIFEVTFFFMPESPYYYMERGNKTEAFKSLMFFRGQSVKVVESELVDIKISVEESMNNKSGIMDILRSKGNLRGLVICSGLFMFGQLCGINAIVFNSQSIFKSATDSIPSEIAALIVPCSQLLFCTVTSAIADRIGRKPILIYSAAFMSLSSIGLGICFYLKESNVDMSHLGWLPIVCLVIFIFAYTGGFGFLIFVTMGEMFPTNVKSIASSILCIVSWVFGFIVTQFYPGLNSLGSYYPFLLYGFFSAVSLVFVLFFVIETKGLSFQEIQYKLNRVK